MLKPALCEKPLRVYALAQRAMAYTSGLNVDLDERSQWALCCTAEKLRGSPRSEGCAETWG